MNPDDATVPTPSMTRLPALMYVMAAATLLVGASGTYALRERDLTSTRRELATLDLVLAEGTSRTLLAISLAVEGVVVQAPSASGADGREAVRRWAGTRATHENLVARTTGLPQLDAIVVVGDDGVLLGSSRAHPVPSVDVSRYEFFGRLGSMGVSETVVTKPVVNMTSGRVTTYVVRRLPGGSGGRPGYVMGAVDLSYLGRHFETLDLGPGTRVTLSDTSGDVYVAVPPLDAQGRSSPDGHGETPVVGASAPVAGSGLVLSLSRPEAAVLSEWYPQAGFVLLASLAGALGATAVGRSVRRRHDAYVELARAVREREEAVEERERVRERSAHAAKLESIGLMAGGVAHDTNNMLAVIVGSLTILKKRAARGETGLERYVDSALEGAGRAADLTRRLLAFSRKSPLAPCPADVAETVRDTAELMRRSLGPDLVLELRLGVSTWPVRVDKGGLETSMLNVALNARDAMPGGGRLTVAARDVTLDDAAARPFPDAVAGDYVRLDMADEGTGMTPDVAARALEPFYTTKEVGHGTGLGLSQVYGFVRQSGGFMAVDTAPGAGTTVSLYLPRSPEAPDGPSRADELPRGHGELVLVVDDEPEVRRLSSEMLRDLGYRTVEAHDGREALDVLGCTPEVRLLFTDYAMPGMDGVTLASRGTGIRPDLKVLFTSGRPRDHVAGGDVVAKPFGSDVLAGMVRRALYP